jgi:hypothetical protein
MPDVVPSLTPDSAQKNYYKASRGIGNEPAPYDPKWGNIDAMTENIEDRRNDPNWRRWFSTVLGNEIMGGSPEEWGKHWRMIKDAFNKTLPEVLAEDEDLKKKASPEKGSELAKQAGVESINHPAGKLPSMSEQFGSLLSHVMKEKQQATDVIDEMARTSDLNFISGIAKGSGVNAERFSDAVQHMPQSSNIEDRRGERNQDDDITKFLDADLKKAQHEEMKTWNHRIEPLEKIQ